MIPGVAAGHPATAAAGWEILVDGGNAADAAVAACLASCVAETVMTGLLGGGHAIYLDGPSGDVLNLDCFCTAPGLGGGCRSSKQIHLQVPFGEEIVHYAVGPGTCAVPGLPAGLQSLWKARGRLPWPRLVEPSLRLAREGVELPVAHASCLAMLAPVLTMDAGARIYAPGGAPLEAGGHLDQPGLVTALELVAAEGAESFYRGSLAEALLDLVAERGGLITRDDLKAYEVAWRQPVELGWHGRRFLTREGLSGMPETVPRLPRVRGLEASARVVALVEALDGEERPGHTTNLTVVDAEGSACVLTTSLGLGSGDFLPGLDLHLNSMLGETDLLRGPLAPGRRVLSMMAPSLVFDRAGLELAIGAAGGTRLRTALLLSATGLLDEGLDPVEAVERPRFHPAGEVLNAEPGVDERGLAELERRGWTVRRWAAPHHYFGGVSLIGRSGAAADPRRSGAVRTEAGLAG
ncbi:MAG: gamma-glutamyltransferase [Gaiellaceae bacterium]